MSSHAEVGQPERAKHSGATQKGSSPVPNLAQSGSLVHPFSSLRPPFLAQNAVSPESVSRMRSKADGRGNKHFGRDSNKRSDDTAFVSAFRAETSTHEVAKNSNLRTLALRCLDRPMSRRWGVNLFLKDLYARLIPCARRLIQTESYSAFDSRRGRTDGRHQHRRRMRPQSVTRTLGEPTRIFLQTDCHHPRCSPSSGHATQMLRRIRSRNPLRYDAAVFDVSASPSDRRDTDHRAQPLAVCRSGWGLVEQGQEPWWFRGGSGRRRQSQVVSRASRRFF